MVIPERYVRSTMSNFSFYIPEEEPHHTELRALPYSLVESFCGMLPDKVDVYYGVGGILKGIVEVKRGLSV